MANITLDETPQKVSISDDAIIAIAEGNKLKNIRKGDLLGPLTGSINSKVSQTQVGQPNGIATLDNEGKVTPSQVRPDTTKIPLTQKAIPNGVATLDNNGKVPASQMSFVAETYKGLWNASNNTPMLADGVGSAGEYYKVSVAGVKSFGGVPYNFKVGDTVIFNGIIWQRSPAPALGDGYSVSEVRAFTGDLPETLTTIDNGGGNWWYNPANTTGLDNTGTIIRTSLGKIYERLGSYISVNNFGAIPGNSGVDNTSAIQAALNTAAAIGVTLYIPGIYYFAGVVTVPSRVTIMGGGYNSGFTKNSNTAVFKYSGSKSVLEDPSSTTKCAYATTRDIKFDTNGSYTGNLIETIFSTALEFQRCQFVNTSDGYQFYAKEFMDSRLIDCFWYYGGRGANPKECIYMQSGADAGVTELVENTNNITFIGCHIEQQFYTSIKLAGRSGNNVYDIKFIGLKVETYSRATTPIFVADYFTRVTLDNAYFRTDIDDTYSRVGGMIKATHGSYFISDNLWVGCKDGRTVGSGSTSSIPNFIDIDTTVKVQLKVIAFEGDVLCTDTNCVMARSGVDAVTCNIKGVTQSGAKISNLRPWENVAPVYAGSLGVQQVGSDAAQYIFNHELFQDTSQIGYQLVKYRNGSSTVIMLVDGNGRARFNLGLNITGGVMRVANLASTADAATGQMYYDTALGIGAFRLYSDKWRRIVFGDAAPATVALTGDIAFNTSPTGYPLYRYTSTGGGWIPFAVGEDNTAWTIGTPSGVTSSAGAMSKEGKQVCVSGSVTLSGTTATIVLPYAPDFGFTYYDGTNKVVVASNSTNANITMASAGTLTFQLNYKTA